MTQQSLFASIDFVKRFKHFNHQLTGHKSSSAMARFLNVNMSISTATEDYGSSRTATYIPRITETYQPLRKAPFTTTQRVNMTSDKAYDKIVLYDPFNFANHADPCQRQLDYGLPFTLKPRQNIDPFQYAYSLAHETAALCMFYCIEVDKTVTYKLVKCETEGDTHTVECMPIKVVDGVVVAKCEGEFFKRDADGVWRDAFSNAKFQGPIADSVKVTDTHYNSLTPLQCKSKAKFTKA